MVYKNVILRIYSDCVQKGIYLRNVGVQQLYVQVKCCQTLSVNQKLYTRYKGVWSSENSMRGSERVERGPQQAINLVGSCIL